MNLYLDFNKIEEIEEFSYKGGENFKSCSIDFSNN